MTPESHHSHTSHHSGGPQAQRATDSVDSATHQPPPAPRVPSTVRPFLRRPSGCQYTPSAKAKSRRRHSHYIVHTLVFITHILREGNSHTQLLKGESRSSRTRPDSRRLEKSLQTGHRVGWGRSTRSKRTPRCQLTPLTPRQAAAEKHRACLSAAPRPTARAAA